MVRVELDDGQRLVGLRYPEALIQVVASLLKEQNLVQSLLVSNPFVHKMLCVLWRSFWVSLRLAHTYDASIGAGAGTGTGTGTGTFRHNHRHKLKHRRRHKHKHVHASEISVSTRTYAGAVFFLD